MGLKYFFLNKQYKFDLDGNCEVGGQVSRLEETELLNVPVNGEVQMFSGKWLSLMAHYEVKLPLVEALKIKFVECKSRVIGLKCGSLMVINSPISFDDGFRIIPGYTGFLINSFGSVKSRFSGRIMKQAIGPYGYPYVNIYDADKGRWRSVSVHILLARAFLSSSDPGHYCFVNHKDGNKLNYSLENLEWVCSRDNNSHAVETGLRNDNLPCKVRDVNTGEVVSLPSVGLALNKIGLLSKSKRVVRKVGEKVIPILFLNRYEIKLVSDLSDWFYSEENRGRQVRMKGPYQALLIESGKVIEGDVRYLIKETGVSEERIMGVMKAAKPKSCQGYTFRVKSDDVWPVNYEPTIFTPPRKISACNVKTLQTVHFDSIRQLVATFPIDKRTLKEKLRSKKSHNGWVFEEESNLV